MTALCAQFCAAQVLHSHLRYNNSIWAAPLLLPCSRENCVWRDGYLTGRSWIIYRGVEAQDQVTHFIAQPKPGGYAPDYMVSAAGLLNLASPPLTGSVAVGFGDYCNIVELGITDTAYGLANKLNSLPGIKGGLNG